MKKKEIKAMISLLDDEDPEVSDEIMKQLHLLGEEAIPYLEEKWENTLDMKLIVHFHKCLKISNMS